MRGSRGYPSLVYASRSGEPAARPIARVNGISTAPAASPPDEFRNSGLAGRDSVLKPPAPVPELGMLALGILVH